MNDSENSYENGSPNANNFEAREPIPALDFNEVEDVCLGVKRYWHFMLWRILIKIAIPIICVLLLFCFPQLALIILFAGIILFSPQPINEPISFSKAAPSFGERFPDLLVLEQMSPEQALQWGRFVFLAIYLAIFVFYGLCLCVPVYKSMVKLYKTPDSVCPNARRFLNASWILFAIAFFVTGAAIYFINASYRNILWAAAFALGLSSYIVFYGFLDRIGAKLLPDNKNCRLAIILSIVTLVFGAALILFFNFLPAGIYKTRLIIIACLIGGGASSFLIDFLKKLQSRCSEILLTRTIPLPVPSASDVQTPSLDNASDQPKPEYNKKTIVMITICVLLLLGKTLYEAIIYMLSEL